MFRIDRCRGAILAVLLLLLPGVDALGQTCDNVGMCSAYDSCGGIGGSCGELPGDCFGAADGGGVCVNGTGLCDDAPDCETAADCPEGSACTDDQSCCGTRKCFPRCVPSCLPTAGLSNCQVAGKGKLMMKVNEDPQRNRLSWRTASAPLFAQPLPFGDPTKNEVGRFCVYDDGDLVMGISVAPSATLWEASGTTGFKFKDREAGAGVAKVGEKQVAADEAKFSVKGNGANLALPAPLSAETYFDSAAILTVQWHSGTDCWSTTFRADEASRNDGAKFVSK